MDLIDVICSVLKSAGEPLHYTDITHRIIGQGPWSTSSSSPEKLIDAAICRHIREKRGSASRILRVERGIYDLTPRFLSPDQPNPAGQRRLGSSSPQQSQPLLDDSSAQPPPWKTDATAFRWGRPGRKFPANVPSSRQKGVGKGQKRTMLRMQRTSNPHSSHPASLSHIADSSPKSAGSLLDQAERILENAGCPMRIADIVSKAVALGTIKSQPVELQVDLIRIAIYAEIEQYGDRSRFQLLGNDWIGLSYWNSFDSTRVLSQTQEPHIAEESGWKS